jgi:Major tropism determinant N-terminal domain
MSTQIQFRRDTAATWTTANPILAQGEVGLETDTSAYKIGDGITAWTDLSYNQLAPELTSLLLDGRSSDPSPPGAGNISIYSKAIGGRMMLKQVGPSGLTTALQPFLARNKVGYWDPPGNATTVPGVFGYTAPTVLGTATTRSVAVTSLFTRMRRIGYASATTAGSLAYQYVPFAQVTLGDGSGNGGFYKVCRFGVSDTTIATTSRMFCGVSSSIVAPTNVEPSTLTNSIGMGHGAADTTMHIYYGGSAAQTPIDLGSNFPTRSVSTDVYELALFAPTNSNNTVYYEVTRLNTGNVATGTLVGTAGTVLPSSSTLLSYHRLWRCNNTTAFAVAFDIMSDYIETDN